MTERIQLALQKCSNLDTIGDPRSPAERISESHITMQLLRKCKTPPIHPPTTKKKKKKN